MTITVELTYDMVKLLGVRRFEIEGARTVQEAVQAVRARCGDQGEAFGQLAKVAAVAVNGVLIAHRRGRATPLVDGDRVGFLKMAAGG